MTYKNIAFLLPLLATSLNGGHDGTGKVPQASAVSAIQIPNDPSKGLVCPLQIECGDGMNATVSIAHLLGVTRITVTAGSSKDSTVTSSASADSVTLTIDCDGQPIDITIGTSATSWSAVASCGQVGQE
jgi:hypothetical protein